MCFSKVFVLFKSSVMLLLIILTVTKTKFSITDTLRSLIDDATGLICSPPGIVLRFLYCKVHLCLTLHMKFIIQDSFSYPNPREYFISLLLSISSGHSPIRHLGTRYVEVSVSLRGVCVRACVRVRVRMRARARARVCVCVCVYVCIFPLRK